MSVLVILVGFLIFFTYKPLFRILKVSKFKFEAIKLELEKQETKKEFNDFALKQANLLTNVVAKIVNLIADFFGKKPKQSTNVTQNDNNANAKNEQAQQTQQNNANAESNLDNAKK